MLAVTGPQAPQGAFLRVTGTEAFPSKLPFKDPHHNQSGCWCWPETEVHLDSSRQGDLLALELKDQRLGWHQEWLDPESSAMPLVTDLCRDRFGVASPLIRQRQPCQFSTRETERLFPNSYSQSPRANSYWPSLSHMTIPLPITAATGRECSNWTAMVHLATPEVWDGATRSEVRVGALLNRNVGLSIRRGKVWRQGKQRRKSMWLEQS